MSRTRNLSDLLDSNGDVKSGALDNVPASNDASALTTGTLPDGRFPATLPAVNGANLTGINTDLLGDTSPQLGGDLDTNGNNINFGDNDKAQFGNNNDLQLYHDGTNSIIEDSGAGVLNLKTNGTKITMQTGGGGTMFDANKQDSVDLYYNNSKKFETTATGVNVDGTAETDGVSVGGSTKWEIELSGDDLIFKYNGTAKIKFASNGEIVTVDDLTAFGTV